MTDRSSSEPPGTPRRRALLAAGAVAAVAAIGLVVWAVAGGDDDTSPRGVDAADSEASDALDEAFPDRPTPADTGPLPTPDPAGAPLAADAFTVVETSWVRSAFDELDFVVLTRNDAEVGFANVNLVAVFVDAAGADIATAPFSYRLVGAGQTVALTGLRPVDPDLVEGIRLESTARGSVPAASPTVSIDESDWRQDETGTVTVSGVVSAAAPAEFVTIVAVLRDDQGSFVGTAFGFLDSVATESVPFEAVGFPAGDVAAIDVFITS